MFCRDKALCTGVTLAPLAPLILALTFMLYLYSGEPKFVRASPIEGSLSALMSNLRELIVHHTEAFYYPGGSAWTLTTHFLTCKSLKRDIRWLL